MMMRSSFQITSSKIIAEDKKALNVDRLISECKAKNINLQKMSKEKLQSSYGMLGFSASHQQTSSVCFIFISTLDEKSFPIYGYVNGQLLLETTVNEDTLPIMIEESLHKARDHPQSTTDDDEKILRSYFEGLHQKTEKVLKSSSNIMQALQQVKTSTEYIQASNQIKILCLQVEELCKTVKARKKKVEIKNQNLLQELKKVEKEKNSLGYAKMHYDSLKEEMFKIPQKLDFFIVEQRQKVEKFDFFDEETFNEYLNEVTTLKKYENQKKFLNY